MKGVHHNRLIRDCIRVPSFPGIHTGIRVVDLNRAVARNASRNEEVAAIGEITRTYIYDYDEAVFEIANEACRRGKSPMVPSPSTAYPSAVARVAMSAGDLSVLPVSAI